MIFSFKKNCLARLSLYEELGSFSFLQRDNHFHYGFHSSVSQFPKLCFDISICVLCGEEDERGKVKG